MRAIAQLSAYRSVLGLFFSPPSLQFQLLNFLPNYESLNWIDFLCFCLSRLEWSIWKVFIHFISCHFFLLWMKRFVGVIGKSIYLFTVWVWECWCEDQGGGYLILVSNTAGTGGTEMVGCQDGFCFLQRSRQTDLPFSSCIIFYTCELYLLYIGIFSIYLSYMYGIWITKQTQQSCACLLRSNPAPVLPTSKVSLAQVTP